MDTVIRKVDEIDDQDRQAIEHLLGLRLHENQQLVIQVITPQTVSDEGAANSETGSKLPEWCDAYEGLSEAEVTKLEQTILTRADFSRPVE